MDTKMTVDSAKKLTEAKTHVCYSPDYRCKDCKYFDEDYHGGYCDDHKMDVKMEDKACSHFWEKR